MFELEQSEAEFQQAVTALANLKGWRWLHIQPGLTERGRYRTPVSGSLGPGWPDLVLVRGERLLFAELKAQRGKVTGLQEEVLGILTGCRFVEVYVWRPSDWPVVLEVLS